MLLKIFLYFVIQNELVPKPHFLNIDISLQVLYFFRQRYLLFGVSQRILKYVAQFLRNLCNFAVISFLLTNFKLNTLQRIKQKWGLICACNAVISAIRSSSFWFPVLCPVSLSAKQINDILHQNVIFISCRRSRLYGKIYFFFRIGEDLNHII